MTHLPWLATQSLLRGELINIPGDVFADPRVDAPLQALLAAQPPAPRSAVAPSAECWS